MPAQIVRAEFDTDQFTGFDHHDPCRFIGNREYPISQAIAHLEISWDQVVTFRYLDNLKCRARL